MLKWLSGKKTYLCGAALIIVQVARLCGIAIPPQVDGIIIGLGGLAVRAAITKSAEIARLK